MAKTRTARTGAKRKPQPQTLGEAVREHLSYLTEGSSLERELADLAEAFPVFALGNEDLPAHNKRLAEFSSLSAELMKRGVWFRLGPSERAEVNELLKKAQALIEREQSAIAASKASAQSPFDSFHDVSKPMWRRRLARFVWEYVSARKDAPPSVYRMARFLATLEAYVHEAHQRLETGLLLPDDGLYRVDDEEAQTRAIDRWKGILKELGYGKPKKGPTQSSSP